MFISGRSLSSSKIWITRQMRDKYKKKAVAHNYRSRSVYKLIELDQKYKLLNPGNVVIDCGAAPGGWSQYISQKVFLDITKEEKNSSTIADDNDGDDNLIVADRKEEQEQKGLVIAIDLLSILPIHGVNFIQGDFTHASIQKKLQDLLKGRKADIVVSDMAPNFSGQHLADHVKSMDLCEAALSLSDQILKSEGSFLCKFLMGGTEEEFKKRLQERFKQVRYEKPDASRPKSTEGYYMCLGYKNNIEP
ncbi:6492_t:CDS:2 [Ambispora gerdemannii]|uniref:rRNA methyltransferase 2, mitochondrial n=1 Tax=Ambispora gerdemannii TaxID=144530 RepID=A0A9N8V7K7_9GLOM|nr:6492_t:CDS:2 [Ambispora gerdemannii]